MSFNITAAGTAEQVSRQLESAKLYGDTSQAELVKRLVREHLGMSQYPGGLLVEAIGHHDAALANLTLTIRPLFLPADTSADNPDGAA